MAKRNIEAELKAYFIHNINTRIVDLKEEITALRAFRTKMFGKTFNGEAKTKTPKKKIFWAHRPDADPKKVERWKKKVKANGERMRREAGQ